MSARLALGAVAALAGLAALGRRGSRAQRARFTQITCPIASSELVDWSTDSWWYPTDTEEIGWSDFTAAVDLDQGTVHEELYLPWKRDWSSWEEFLAREPSWSESFYRTRLPSGQVAWVWNASGVEHWYTVSGDLDVEQETELLVAAQQRLDDLSDGQDVTIEDVRRVLSELQ
jgi:hypothetical protein